MGKDGTGTTVGVVLVFVLILVAASLFSKTRKQEEAAAPRAAARQADKPDQSGTGEPSAPETAQKASKAPSADGDAIQENTDEAMVRRALEAPITIEFEDTPLPDVIKFLRGITNLDIYLDHNALDEVLNPVTAAMTEQPIRIVLRDILEPHRMTYKIDGKRIIVSSKLVLEPPEIRTYDIGRLLDGQHGQAADAAWDVVLTVTTLVKPDRWNPSLVKMVDSGGERTRDLPQRQDATADVKEKKQEGPRRALVRDDPPGRRKAAHPAGVFTDGAIVVRAANPNVMLVYHVPDVHEEVQKLLDTLSGNKRP